jgi:putative methyltransferase (TIGR04325 family)
MFAQIIKNIKKKINPLFSWKGNFNTWDDAKKSSKSYDNELIFDKIFKANHLVKHNENWFERDGSVFEKTYINPYLLSGILFSAINKSKLTILDFGGSLGSVYKQHFKFLKEIPRLSWNIVEQETIVLEGKEKYTDDYLKFQFNIIEYKNLNPKTDLIILSSVIQYIEKPFELLKNLIELKSDFIIVDLTVISNHINKDFVAIQKINKTYYGTEISYPCWFFNKENFLNFFLNYYELLVDSKSYTGTIAHGKKSYDYSFLLFKRKMIHE